MKASGKQASAVLVLSSATFLLCLTIGRFYYKNRRKEEKLADELNRNMPKTVEKEVTVKEINELNNLIKQNDPSFMVKFYEKFPSFVAKITEMACPSLNHSEIEICAYAKLAYSTKEIALYGKYSMRSVENRKHRVRRKLMLSPEIDFLMWIASVK